jgi:putative redox protein
MDPMKVEIHQSAVSTSEARIRQHKVLIDRPVAKGGEDKGAMGGELFLASVGGCFMSNLLAAIKARGAAITGAKAEVTGILLESPARFASININVSAKYADRAEFEKLVEIAERGCVMVNTLRGKLELTVQIGDAE